MLLVVTLLQAEEQGTSESRNVLDVGFLLFSTLRVLSCVFTVASFHPWSRQSLHASTY